MYSPLKVLSGPIRFYADRLKRLTPLKSLTSPFKRALQAPSKKPPTSHRLQSMVISTTTSKWSDNEVNPTNAPTSERFSQTRLILAALQAHHNKNSEFVQNSDAKLPTSNSTMIIICTMSTPLSSIRFLLSAQVLSAQGQTETNLSLVKQPRHGITRACSHRKTVLLFNQACKRLR